MNKPKLMDFIKEIKVEGVGKVATIDFANYAFALEKYVSELERKETTVMDANRKFVKVQQLLCKKCGKPYGVKTPEGFTQFYAKVEGQTCCCKEVET